MLHLRKQLSPLLRAASHPTTVALSSSLHRRAHLLSSVASPRTPTPFSIEDYLVATCGLTGVQALKASKKLSHLKSASKPDAVLALLSGVGLSRPDIAAVVAADPPLLRARVDSIAHRLASLRDRVGLSDPQIARFLLDGGSLALHSCDVAPRLEFWIPFFGSFDKLLQTVKRNKYILKRDLEKVAKPNIALLEQCGLSVCDIVKPSTRCSRLLGCNPERVKAIVLRAEKLGVPRTSHIFKYAVGVACSLTEDKVAARMEFLRSTLGCSMEKIRVTVGRHPNILGLSEEKLCRNIEFLRNTLGCPKDKLGVAVCMQPQLLGLSVEKLRRKIEFMITEIGMEPEYIVERLHMLTFSLEKRLVPRHYVVKILQAKGLMKNDASFYTIVCYVDKDFIAKCIDSHKDAVPGLADAYAAVRAGTQSPTLMPSDRDVGGSFRLIANATHRALMLIS